MKGVVVVWVIFVGDDMLFLGIVVYGISYSLYKQYNMRGYSYMLVLCTHLRISDLLILTYQNTCYLCQGCCHNCIWATQLISSQERYLMRIDHCSLTQLLPTELRWTKERCRLLFEVPEVIGKFWWAMMTRYKLLIKILLNGSTFQECFNRSG